MLNFRLAHAFGQVYNLPVPLWLYLYGGAAAVILSFVVVGFMVSQSSGERHFTEKIGRIPSAFLQPAQVLSVLIFALVIISGLVGSQLPLLNFNVTFFWIIFLLGFTYLTALLGNLWDQLNPAQAIMRWLERGGLSFSPRLPYPKGLGYYPAVVLYFLIIWLELLSGGWAVVPHNLSVLLLMYLGITLVGSAVYGRTEWLKHGDFFTVFFDLVARVAPLHYRRGEAFLRAPFVGLLDDDQSSFSLLMFGLFMLASTAFDGFRETSAYFATYNLIAKILPGVTPSRQTVGTMLLLLAPLCFLAIYWSFIWIMGLIVKAKLTTQQLAYRFAFSLVPIAVAYNVAHYYTLLIIQGQQIIRLVSDPFGWGWNLLHTAGYKINVGLVGAATVWYSQVTLIVIGHIAAVYLAHVLSLKIFPSAREALLSQYPMLVLMVVYTMTSLWIIAQPITTR